MTGIGPVAVRQPRVRDRERTHQSRPIGSLRRSCRPTCAARSRSRRAAILYLKGSRWRLLRGAGCAARQGCRRVVGIRHRPAEDGWLDEHTACRSGSSQALRLHLGRWHPSPGRLENEKQCILVLIGADAGGPQGTGRLHRWRSRERARLARSAARSEAARARRCRRGLPSPTARSVWKAAVRSGRQRASSAAGCTRPPTCSPSAEEPKTAEAKRALRRSGWPRPRRSPSWLFDAFVRATR